MLTELWGVVPDMCRELTPEKNALLIQQLLIEKVVRLVCLTEGIKASIGDLFDARTDLFWCKGMTIAQEMLIFTSTIDEYRLTIQIEAVVGRSNGIVF